jgi:hypothetical protein
MELTGGKADTQQAMVKIAELEENVLSLIAKSKRLRQVLVEWEAYKPLERLVVSFGLDFGSFSNSKAVIRRLVSYNPSESDGFDRDSIEIAISLVNVLAQKSRLQAELDRLRIIEIDGVAPGNLVSLTSTEEVVEPKLETPQARSVTASDSIESPRAEAEV